MNRRLVALAAAFVLLVSGATPGMAQVRPPGPDAAPAPVPNLVAPPLPDPKVPHYFGPWPNWANSQLTLPDVAVAITGGGGTGAAASATIGANGTVTSLTITDPGSGYTSPPTVTFSGAGGPSASASATINTTGSVTSVTVNNGGTGYTNPSVTFNGGSALPVTKTQGNPLIDRAYATDYNVPPTITPASVAPAADGIAVAFDVSVGTAVGGTFTLSADAVTTGAIPYNAAPGDIDAAFTTAGLLGTITTGAGPTWNITFPAAPGAFTVDGNALTQPAAPALVPVLVVVPTPLPVGTLTAFQAWNQATQGGSPTPSAGGRFHAYVLRPVAGNYTVVYDSGLLPVPALTIPGTSEAVSYPAGNVPILAGDVIAFYGAGIPTDTGTGADVVAYPAPAAPVQGATITVPSAGFPTIAAREYSFAATVLDATGVLPATTNATATAYGGVNAVTLVDPGSGYTMPTVDFDFPDDPAGVQASGHTICAAAVATDPDVACSDPLAAQPLVIKGVVVDTAGSGYSAAPGVVIRDGTATDPILGATPAVAKASLTIQTVVVNTFGAGYQVAPTVTITDPTGSGASATASTDVGVVSSLTLANGGSGYLTPGIKKFEDALPGLCLPPACPTAGKYIPLAVPAAKTYSGQDADEYVIGLVQYETSFSSSLPPTLARGYVQLETPETAGISQHWPVTNLVNGVPKPVYKADGITQWLAVTPPQWLGPTIAATKDRAVRIEFHNLLPTGADGNLFLPVDSSLMGSGAGPVAGMLPPAEYGTVADEVRNPACSQPEKWDNMDCFRDNRATLHLHGGTTPWISDGTPHQWITPAGETTNWPQGVSVSDVPDMNVCKLADDGCQTFYYTNQQSARLMFYHDHAWGITRLNVYAGEAAGYLITDTTEQKLISDKTIPGPADTIPLVVQDRTFVPDAAQLALQDPTWDSTRWGTKGSFWYHHVYMPAQNPGDPSGMSAYGRWMYGPWFWPPASPQYPPIDNPYYDATCNLDVSSTWTYPTDPFCEPKLIPGTPNISVGMEQFNDTPIVNGVAYPTVTLEPKTYRLRMLNAANDRFMNFQWYVGEAATASTGLNRAGQPIGPTEVALNPAEVAAAQTDINVSPTPVQGAATAGPDWVQIGTEGGFLPAPAVIDGQQPTTWITDPTRFDVGNVDKHSLLLAPAERADAIVDFSKYAPGTTLILYNDAPAAFPARVASYDYYTGAPDTGAGQIIPGYGPNTRTIMQVKIAGTAAPAFNLTTLQNAFKHHADGSGVFEKGQHPIIVGQAAYNSAYGKTFAASGNCTDPNGTNKCDGFARINQQGYDLFRFDNLKGSSPQLKIPLQPKALHDEMNSAAFDEFGRMTANLGLEAVPANPAAQNILLYPYIAPPTEVIDGTNLPKDDLNVQAISDAKDGTQIWKITHNGVDTHPIHFHLYDVQVLNRVTWDNIIIPTEASELGWKDTVRISPLEDTIVALRPIVPKLPFEIPNSIRPLSPMMPAGANLNNTVGPFVDPVAPYNVSAVTNVLVNFGWEYVYHCHILSHEEMDMMRPVLLALPPKAADSLTYTVTGNGNNTRLTLTWKDNSIAETSYLVQKRAGTTGAWTTIGGPPAPALTALNTAGSTLSFVDTSFRWNSTVYSYRVIARNTVGYGGAYPQVNADSTSTPVAALQSPTGLTAALQANPTGGVQVNLGFTDNLSIETGFAIERSTDGGVTFTQIATAPARAGTGAVTFVDTTANYGTTYAYRVADITPLGKSGYTNTASVVVPAQPAAPLTLTAVNGGSNGNNRSVNLIWTVTNVANVTGFTVQRSAVSNFASGVTSTNVATGARTLTVTGLSRGTAYYFRIRANNGAIVSSGYTNAVPFPITTLP